MLTIFSHVFLITMVMMYGDQEDQIIILGSDPEPYCRVPQLWACCNGVFAAFYSSFWLMPHVFNVMGDS
jgi:hypothetical protein